MNIKTISAELVCMIAGIHAEIEILHNNFRAECKNQEGGIGTYCDIGTVAQIAENYLDSRFDFDEFDGVYCYDIHDNGEAIKKLYLDLARQCHDFHHYGESEVIEACKNFLLARTDLKGVKP